MTVALPRLDPDEFGAFFYEVHGHTTFPWQARLARELAETGRWPALMDLPTGSGKTAVLDIAVFALALEADRGARRVAAVRTALVVDRRLVVDDSYARAKAIADALGRQDPGPVTARVAARLRHLSGDGPPLIARRLRGGIPQEADWARSPAQPTLLCSTVDQVGSRLLFRGYGVSDRAKPIHAGLLGSDCRIFLDEAHLAEPFRETLEWVGLYRGERWQEVPGGPWGVSVLSATPRAGTGTAGDVFHLSEDDYADPLLGARWRAAKPARLVARKRGGRAKPDDPPGDDAEAEDDLARRVEAVAAEVERAATSLREAGVSAPAIGVVMNRVARARAVFDRLESRPGVAFGSAVLLIGPSRPVEREEAANEALAPIHTGARKDHPLEKGILVVATQCIEAGVDIDLDALITEAAPIDALRQRFGRLNREGRDVPVFAAIVCSPADVASSRADPVYGHGIAGAWQYLIEAAADVDGGKVVDFGLGAFDAIVRGRPVPPEATSDSTTSGAPILMPAHVDLLAHTSPVPSADPEVGLYLHGVEREPASVTVVWRADIEPDSAAAVPEEAVRRLLLLVPPRSGEAIELPVWAVRSWLGAGGRGLPTLADAPSAAPEDLNRSQGGGTGGGRPVFRWAGEDGSGWIRPRQIRVGDTLVVPARYGGVDRFGWTGSSGEPDPLRPVADVADDAARSWEAHRYMVRVAPGLVAPEPVRLDRETAAAAGRRISAERAAAGARVRRAIAEAPSRRWTAVRDALASADLPVALKERLERLSKARGGRVELYTDLYGAAEDGTARGVVFAAPLGLDDASAGPIGAGSTEDDWSGSMAGYARPQSLRAHSDEVAAKAESFARLAGLPESIVADIALAAYLHDVGKADPRFQAMLSSGDPLGPDPHDEDRVLAKSGRRPLPGEGERAGLPPAWRHEALSVRLALAHPRLAQESVKDGRDLELVLWLIGTHHGWGRPLFPHDDPRDRAPRADLPEILGATITLPAGPGPQSLAFDLDGRDWAGMFDRLRARYGAWDLARLEAVLRLADHRASEAAQQQGGASR